MKAQLQDGAKLGAGDLFAVRLNDVRGMAHLLLSFHGDSNGLSTVPVLEAAHKVARTMDTENRAAGGSGVRMVCGMDANCYAKQSDGKLFVGLHFVRGKGREQTAREGVGGSESAMVAADSWDPARRCGARGQARSRSLCSANVGEWLPALRVGFAPAQAVSRQSCSSSGSRRAGAQDRTQATTGA